MKKIAFLVGPTAVGKTEVSIHLAKLLNAEILCCDSMQVYRGMDIGTQKPTTKEQKKVPHHMVDVISPSKNFSVADYRQKSLEIINDILKRGKMPLFVGGTGLYMKSMVDGLFPSPPADRKLRANLLKEEDFKQGALYRRLLSVDIETASKLHPNDKRRIVRALEVYLKTGVAISELKKKTSGLAKKYDIRIFCLNCNRQYLYKRIEDRVDKMFRQGLVCECEKLKTKELSLTASQALGYKEVFMYLKNEISLQEAKDLIKKNTRH
ncbi:MAG: tRNA (adenosine(37)-N6)-dimethylallyltransferase MiaA, partial [Candidatus Omnitrophota bacterium]